MPLQQYRGKVDSVLVCPRLSIRILYCAAFCPGSSETKQVRVGARATEKIRATETCTPRFLHFLAFGYIYCCSSTRIFDLSTSVPEPSHLPLARTPTYKVVMRHSLAAYGGAILATAISADAAGFSNVRISQFEQLGLDLAFLVSWDTTGDPSSVLDVMDIWLETRQSDPSSFVQTALEQV